MLRRFTFAVAVPRQQALMKSSLPATNFVLPYSFSCSSSSLLCQYQQQLSFKSSTTRSSSNIKKNLIKQEVKSDVTFTFIDTTQNNKESDPISYPSDKIFSSVLHSAAEQFGFESGAVVSGFVEKKTKISRRMTAGNVHKKYGNRIRIVYTGPD